MSYTAFTGTEWRYVLLRHQRQHGVGVMCHIMVPGTLPSHFINQHDILLRAQSTILWAKADC